MIEINDFLASNPYSPATIRTYEYILKIFCADVSDIANITPSNLLKFIRRPGWGNARQCVALAAIQKYLRHCYGATHPALSAKIKRITGQPQRALDEKTALLLLASFNRYSPKGSRDLALCALALDTGLRAAELCRLKTININLIDCSLEVIVKGGKWASAVYTPLTAVYISDWQQYQITQTGYLFTNTKTGKGLTTEGLFNIVKEWGKKINIKLSPHDLRRSFACLSTQLLKTPEIILMSGGRWSNTAMIQRYTRTLKLENMRDYLPMLKLIN